MIAAFAAAAAMSLTGAPTGGAPKQTSPICRVVRGRMALSNGTPSVRIWVVGTRRILGVVQQDETLDDLPNSIRKLWNGKNPDADWNSVIYGDFKVCADAPLRPGRMQMVEVAEARRLVLRPRP